MTNAVSVTGKVIGETLVPEREPPPPTPVPYPGYQRSIAEIESLAPGCRSPSEQNKLDEHIARQQKRRTPSVFELDVLNSPLGIYWPNDHRPTFARPVIDLQEEMERVAAQFAQWRGER